jgi:hypothetical protein
VFGLVVVVYYLNIIPNVWIPEPYFGNFACYGNGPLCGEFNGKRMVAVNDPTSEQEDDYDHNLFNRI